MTQKLKKIALFIGFGYSCLLLLNLAYIKVFGQTPAQSLTVVLYSNITSSSRLDGCDPSHPCIDNRSQFLRQSSLSSYRAFGTGTWSLDMQWADVTPTVWTSFGSTAQVSNATPPSGIGFGIGPASLNKNYHDYIRFVFSGNATIQNYSGTRQFWWLPAVASIAFPITPNQGGTGVNLPLYTIDAAYIGSTLSAACAAATSAGETLLLTQVWTVAASFSCAARVQEYGGGIIKPASGQVVTLNGAFIAPTAQVFDCSLSGSSACIQFGTGTVDTVYPQWFKLPGAANDTASIQQAINSLPAIASVSPYTVRNGRVTLLNGTYIIDDTLILSPRTTVSCQSAQGTTIRAAVNFAPATEKFMIFYFNQNGVGASANNNFASTFQNCALDGITNSGNGHTSGISWAASIDSRLDSDTIYTFNRGVVIGGGAIGGGAVANSSADNVSISNLFLVTKSTGPQCPVAIDIPQSSGANTMTILNTKIAGDDDTNANGCNATAKIHIGGGVIGVHFDGLNAEAAGRVLVTDGFNADIVLKGVVAQPHLQAGACPTLSANPDVVALSTSGSYYYPGTEIGGGFTCYAAGVTGGLGGVDGTAIPGMPVPADTTDTNLKPLGYSSALNYLQVVGSSVQQATLNSTVPAAGDSVTNGFVAFGNRPGFPNSPAVSLTALANNGYGSDTTTVGLISVNHGGTWPGVLSPSVKFGANNGLYGVPFIDGSGGLFGYRPNTVPANANTWGILLGSGGADANPVGLFQSCNSAVDTCKIAWQFSQAPGGAFTNLHFNLDPAGTENVSIGNVTTNAGGLFLGLGALTINGSSGVTCPTGSPTSSFATVKGIVTHC